MARRKHDAEFKGMVALEAIKNELTIAEICKKYGICPTQVKTWKAEAIQSMAVIFSQGKKDLAGQSRKEEEYGQLERKIGQLTVENDYLKKNLTRYHRKSGS